jgi:thiol-disulfide isomerase/thioredoxin
MKQVVFVLLFIPLIAVSQKRFNYQLEVVKSEFFQDQEVFIAPAIFTTANEYNEAGLKVVSLAPKQRRYHYSGTLNYPVPVSFSYIKEEGTVRRAITSDYLFLDSGSFSISLGDLAKNKKIYSQVNSRSNREYTSLRALYKGLEVTGSSSPRLIAENIEKRDKVLRDYVETHPDSYVAMWVLINDYHNNGYSVKKEETTKLFSEAVVNSQPFRALMDKIRNEKSLAVNHRFPFGRFLFGKKMQAVVENARYTLVDFWASYCKPCIAQLPALKSMYDASKGKGFQIYSVSTDNQLNLIRMDSILYRNDIRWTNSVDLSGLQSSKLNIHAIPMNFLLDSTGKIIAFDMTMPELERFLKSKE